MNRRTRQFSFVTLVVLCCILAWPPASQSAQRVELKAADGFPLVGQYSPAAGKGSNGPAVLLLHMYKNRKESWQPLVEVLQAGGISTLALDMRGHGESRHNQAGVDQQPRVQARDASLFNAMHLDGLAALSWLRTQGYDPLAVVGASVGCSVAMHMVAEANPKLSAVVLMTPGRDYLGIDTMSHLQHWPGTPLLILSSQEEKGRGALAIHQNLQKRGAELVLFDEESIHGTMMFGEVNDVEGKIAAWLARHMRP